MVNANVLRTPLFSLLLSMNLVGCAAQVDERDESTGAEGEALGSALLAAAQADVGPGSVAPSAADKDNRLQACWPRIEASGWYCCGRFRECKSVYICEYCTNSKSCYLQGTENRSSPGCY
jgi:hypothetical protein